MLSKHPTMDAMVAVGAMAMSSELRRLATVLHALRAKRFPPAFDAFGVIPHEIELRIRLLRGAGFREGGVGAVALCEIA